MSVGRGRQEMSLCDDRGHAERHTSHCRNIQNTHDGRDDSKQHYTDIQCYVMSIQVHRQCSRESNHMQYIDETTTSRSVYTKTKGNTRIIDVGLILYVHFTIYIKIRYTILCTKYENVL